MKLFHNMSVLKLTLRHCLHDALTKILEYHAHTHMGNSPSHTELVYTFIIIIEKILQKLWEPPFWMSFFHFFSKKHLPTPPSASALDLLVHAGCEISFYLIACKVFPCPNWVQIQKHNIVDHPNGGWPHQQQQPQTQSCTYFVMLQWRAMVWSRIVGPLPTVGESIMWRLYSLRLEWFPWTLLSQVTITLCRALNFVIWISYNVC